MNAGELRRAYWTWGFDLSGHDPVSGRVMISHKWGSGPPEK